VYALVSILVKTLANGYFNYISYLDNRLSVTIY